MICHRCLQRALRSSSPSLRPFSSSRVRHTSTTLAPSTDGGTIPASEPSATPSPNSSATQPFTVPFSASPIARGQSKTNAPPSAVVRSSVRAGTPLKGLNFTKGKTDPVAMEDGEYPDWLWQILDGGTKKAAGEAKIDEDLFSKSRTKRAKAIKRSKAAAAAAAAAAGPAGDEAQRFPPVPLYEQTIDLPTAADGSAEAALAAAGARGDLTRAMRQKRRATIKEQNFLKTMR